MKLLSPILVAAGVLSASAAGSPKRFNEFVEVKGHTKKSHVVSPLPYT